MLNDLGSPAFEGLDPGLEALRLPFYLDFPVPLTGSGAAQQGKTAFLRVIGFCLAEDFGVQHQAVAAALLENDDFYALADHIGGHPHTAFPVMQQCIHQIPGDGKILFRGGPGLPGQQNGIVNQLSNHNVSPFDGCSRMSTKKGGPKAAQHEYYIRFGKESQWISYGKCPLGA